MTYFENLGSSYMSHFARRLADLINEQGAEVLAELHLITPATAISAMQFMDQSKDMAITVSDLAQALNVTHQMASQRVNKLIQLKLIERISNAHNKKSKQIILTTAGHDEIKALQPFMEKMQLVFNQLEAEIGVELTQIMYKTETSLRKKTLSDRYHRK